MRGTLRSGLAVHCPALGLGLYDRAPMWGFALEMVYGLVCWCVFLGSRSLLAAIVLGNLANITLFSAAIPGPEQYLAGHPLMVVTLVFAQIVSDTAADRSARYTNSLGPRRTAVGRSSRTRPSGPTT